VEGDDTPSVEKEELGRWGVECVRVYGRKSGEDGVTRYDGKGLAAALGAILGRRDGRSRSRRNTLEM